MVFVLSVMLHFSNCSQTFLEIVLLEPVVGECTANAVFAEAGTLDADFAQNVERW